MSASNNKLLHTHIRQKIKAQRGIKSFFFTNAFGILASRILGFLRDAMQAAVLGTSIYSDIFFIAFKFPNMFRRVVSEGAFVQSFLPFFLSAKSKGAFSVSIFWIFSIVILLLSLFVMYQAPFITKILALGYDDSRIALAIPLVKIHFWYLILIFIVTYFSTLLQYKNIFWVNAYNTLLLNLAMIIAMLPYNFTNVSQNSLYDIATILSYSVLVGGVCQILLHFYPMYASKIWLLQYVGYRHLKSWISRDARLHSAIRVKYRFLRLLSDVRSFFRAFFPAMIGASSVQIIAIIDSSMITLLPDSTGGVSIINYANRIFQLPLALFVIALSSALFPTIAKAIKDKNDILALRHLTNAFWFLLVVLCLCTLGAIMLSNEIIWLLFERKNFTRDDTLQVSLALCGYMLGLIPYGLAKILSLWLYSKKKQAVAAKISVVSLGIGTILLVLFIVYMRYATNGSILWDYRYFIVALCSSIAGVMLLALSIVEFGIRQFLAIIKHGRFTSLLIFLLLLEFSLIKIFKAFFSIT